MKRFLLRAVVLGVVVWWAVAGGPWVALLQWPVVLYVCWRAFPAVAADLRAVLSVVRPRLARGRRARAGGLL